MKILIRYFAAARHAAGCEEQEQIVESPLAVDQLIAALAPAGSELAALLGRCTYLVNETAAMRAELLRDGDLVDVLPPVAGG